MAIDKKTEAEAEVEDAEQVKSDETVPGGMYIVDGYVRNADGELIKGATVNKKGAIIMAPESAKKPTDVK